MFFSLICYIGLCSAIMSSSGVFVSCIQTETSMDPYKRAQYHLDGLMESLDEIQTSHVIFKRSTEEKQEDIINSLAVVCSKLDAGFPGKIDDATKNTSKSNVFLTNSNWERPPLFPIKVEAERMGSKVKITFDVSHTSKTTVETVYTFDHQKKLIDAPEGQKTPTTSPVQFVVDSPDCNEDMHSYSDLNFLFSESEDYNTVYAIINLCKFDKSYNSNTGTYEKKAQKVFTQVPPSPRFRLLNDPGKEIFIKKGENPVFTADINLNPQSLFLISYLFWDWETSSFRMSNVYIDWSGNETHPLKVNHEEKEGPMYKEGLLKVDILKIKALSNDSNVEDQPGKSTKEVNARISITVNIGFRKISGDLVFSYSRWRPGWEANLISNIYTQRRISLKLPYKVYALPRNRMTIETKNFSCDKYGNSFGQPKHGKNCTIYCNAIGSDIKSVFIIKTSPYRPPIKSSSFVINGKIFFAQQDVGPASKDNEGTYRCIAISKNGNITEKKFTLTTQRIEILHFNMENLSNGTSLIQCSASGSQPLNITIDVFDYDSTQRLDTMPGSNPVLETSESETKLTLFVDTMEQFSPAELTCRVEGENGESSAFFYTDENNEPTVSNSTYPYY